MAALTLTRPAGVNDPGLLEVPWWAPKPPAPRPDIDAFVARLVSRRAEAEYLAEKLIEALDAADPDPDLEPSFGYLPNGAVLDECEPDCDGELSGDENEPWLGSLDRLLDQTRWGAEAVTINGSVDLERDRSDYEPNGDELDGFDDNGIADRDGLAEQCGQRM